jgi:putative ABC transport system permease protein
MKRWRAAKLNKKFSSLKKWLDPVYSAWTSIVTHKLRSCLTILGIVIGIAAVIALMSIGRGAEAQIMSRIQGLGADLIGIRPGMAMAGGIRGGFGSANTLTMEDAEAIREQIPYIAALAPTFSSYQQLVAGNQNMNAQVIGTAPEYMFLYNLEVADGAFFTDYEYQRGARVAVLGANVKQTLFGDESPVGQQMRIGGNIVRVMGVLKPKGAVWASPDDAVIIPLTAMQQMVTQPRTSRGERVVTSIALKVTDQKQIEFVTQQITDLLRSRHRIAPGAENDFNITSVQAVTQALSEATSTMTLFLSAVAAISLLVGGIGVMNIMLVSVLERTREIGILKALGARERDIWGQFLTESAFLTFTGGIIGVVVGCGASLLLSKLKVMTTLLSPDIIILAVVVSLGVGLFFGFYPAWNASRLDPIEALRYE